MARETKVEQFHILTVRFTQCHLDRSIAFRAAEAMRSGETLCFAIKTLKPVTGSSPTHYYPEASTLAEDIQWIP
jgi:Tfp pilus assembly protein PilX